MRNELYPTLSILIVIICLTLFMSCFRALIVDLQRLAFADMRGLVGIFSRARRQPLSLALPTLSQLL